MDSVHPRGKTRIIPARAGFTAMTWTPRSGRTDHPRSRGVYAFDGRDKAQTQGSSPLARGLRRHRRGAHLEGRIIPARAGFTGQLRVGRDSVRDHPRSRGVYSLVGSLADAGFGSSPLARGLPPEATDTKVRAGIIPARAGFTSRTLSRRRGSPGSSPLARGLPRYSISTRIMTGIIPARAGFTGFAGY